MIDELRALSFAGITPAMWEQMTGQARQDKYVEAQWRARVWMRIHGLRPGRRRGR